MVPGIRDVVEDAVRFGIHGNASRHTDPHRHRFCAIKHDPHLEALRGWNPVARHFYVGEFSRGHALSLANSPANRNHSGCKCLGRQATKGDAGRLPGAQSSDRVFAKVRYDPPIVAINAGEYRRSCVDIGAHSQLHVRNVAVRRRINACPFQIEPCFGVSAVSLSTISVGVAFPFEYRTCTSRRFSSAWTMVSAA